MENCSRVSRGEKKGYTLLNDTLLLVVLEAKQGHDGPVVLLLAVVVGASLLRRATAAAATSGAAVEGGAVALAATVAGAPSAGRLLRRDQHQHEGAVPPLELPLVALRAVVQQLPPALRRFLLVSCTSRIAFAGLAAPLAVLDLAGQVLQPLVQEVEGCEGRRKHAVLVKVLPPDAGPARERTFVFHIETEIPSDST